MRSGYISVLVAMAVAAVGVHRAGAAIAVIHASTQVIPLDNSISGNNDAVALADSPGSVTVQVSGNSTFGSQPGETYDAAPLVYTDAANKLEYAVSPNNSAAVLSGSHYNFAFLTDNEIPDNTGSTTVTELNSASIPITSGTIFAGSLTPAQTGVALLTNANSQFFLTPATPAFYNVSVTGSAAYDAAGDPFGSVVVQYRDATNGIAYASLPIGSSQTYFGFRFYVFLAEPTALVGTGSGDLTVNVTAVPEASSVLFLAAGAFPLLRRRQAGTRQRVV